MLTCNRSGAGTLDDAAAVVEGADADAAAPRDVIVEATALLGRMDDVAVAELAAAAGVRPGDNRCAVQPDATTTTDVTSTAETRRIAATLVIIIPNGARSTPNDG